MERGMKKLQVLDKFELNIENLNNDNLNDSIGSEFRENDEKSVSQKIRDQTNLTDRNLFNTISPAEYNKIFNRFSSIKQNPQNLSHFSANDFSRVQSLRNDSTNLISHSNSQYYTNSNSMDTSYNNISIEEKKKIHSLIKLKENEITELTKKYDSLKKKFTEKRKHLNDNKTEYERIKLINQSVKKLILALINHKSDR